jgi:TRAP-type C4-dicarboxylate transport system permease small subunit
VRRAGSGLYETAIRHALATTMAVLLAIMILQVVYRYGLNSSLIWAEEICRYLLIAVSFLACGIAYARGEIAAILIVDRLLPPRAARVVALVRNALVLGLLGVLIYYGWRYAVLSGTQPVPGFGFLLGDLLGRPTPSPVTVFWIYVTLPAGMSLLGFHVAGQMVRDARALLSPGGGDA